MLSRSKNTALFLFALVAGDLVIACELTPGQAKGADTALTLMCEDVVPFAEKIIDARVRAADAGDASK